MTNRQKLVFYLMDKGLSNDEVARALADVAEAALEEFTNEAMGLFSDEEKKAIEDAPNAIDADDLVKKYYQEKSGKNAEERLEQLIEEHAASYMHEEESHASAGMAQ